ncbi:diguanylate cyclase CdgB [Streptomyces sp. NPDC007856]|uniref:diguanylate cyclase CdgB n=1 Tax=Streptomyces sp. NPDC007856 TaxID=3364781 RepID=UPI0036A0E31B
MDGPYDLQTAVEGLHRASSLADTLQAVSAGAVSALGFEVACLNLVRPDGDLIVASFAGDAEVEARITGRVGSREAWERRLAMGEAWGDLRFIPHIEGRILDDDVPQWYSDGPSDSNDGGWHPLDRLFAPMYLPLASARGDGPSGELIGVLSVDRPRSGRRPGLRQREALQSYAFQARIAVSTARMRSNMQRALVRLEREQQALRSSEESFRQAFEYAPNGFAIAEMDGDSHGRILRTNDALCRLLGRPASAMRRYSLSDLVHPEDIETLLTASMEGGSAELRLGRRDGTYIWVSLRNSVVADTVDGPRFLLTHVQDIEERKRREFQLAYRASHDHLTGLPNSPELRARLGALLCQHPSERDDAGFPAAEEDGASNRHIHRWVPQIDHEDNVKGLAIILCGLDGFKSINDVLGYSAGDEVLVEVAKRLSRVIQAGDTVARLRGDEFVILVDGLGGGEARNFAIRLRNEITQPIRAGNQLLRVDASFGVGWAACGMTVDEILQAAEVRMASEKRTRSGQHNSPIKPKRTKS